ncbi:MAG: 1-acyl-sn-glycerol-3-phosphate acyltransferase [Clostridia bacterium]|nr:1-acyl-sn-glycerol-3-phosphate acyltransferase [Clostridia bacterium]
MKIKTIAKSYDEVMAIKPPKHERPKKTNIFWQTLTKIISQPALFSTHFTHKEIGMERLGKDEQALILMNHTGFTDFEIAYSMLYPRKFNTVAAFETFMGLEWLMKSIGCFATRKYIADLQLIRDIKHCLEKNKSSVLMFPEAVYTLDGTCVTLPSTLARFIKMLGVPLCILKTNGVYLHNPAYGYLKPRDVPIHAELCYVLSPEEIKAMSVEDIEAVLERDFSFDDFRWQKENGIVIDEPFRAEGLHNILYKCPHCGKEGEMHSEGIHLSCCACGKTWELTELGYLKATEGEDYFDHVPDWYRWERECVRREVLEGSYGFDVPCDIMMIVDTKALYKVGSGRLSHSKDGGFHLTGCDGKLDYHQSSRSMYTCEATPYWYQIDDVIGMGDSEALYFAFPTEHREVVGKVKLAVEEIFKILEEEERVSMLEREAAKKADQ